MPPQALVRVPGRLRKVVVYRESEFRRWIERCQTECVDQYQPAHPAGALEREPRGDGAAEQLPHQCRWRHAGVLDQLAEPRQHPFGIQQAITDLGCTMTWKIGRDYAMRRHESRDHTHPVRRITSGAVQQHDGRAVTALQYGSRYAMDVHSSFSDRESR